MKRSEKRIAEPILLALASAMGFSGRVSIVWDYLEGRSVRNRIGTHGEHHFANMVKLLGLTPPTRLSVPYKPLPRTD